MSIACTLRTLEVGQSHVWPIERDVTVRNAATRVMLMDPSKKIVCNYNRPDRTIRAERVM